MKHLYFVSNNLVSKASVIYPKTTTFNEVREKTMLSSKGEEKAISLIQNNELESVEVVYSSPYFCALNTGKYIAEANDIDLVVDKRLGERVVGELGCNEYRFLKGMQEHDFSYKLQNGESINEVRERMEDFLREVLKSAEKNILVVTHNVALFSLLLFFCNKGFNVHDRLILDYEEQVIMDGVFHSMDLIQIDFDDNKCVSVRRLI